MIRMETQGKSQGRSKKMRSVIRQKCPVSRHLEQQNDEGHPFGWNGKDMAMTTVVMDEHTCLRTGTEYWERMVAMSLSCKCGDLVCQ